MVEDLLVQFWSRNCLYMFTIFLSSKQWFLFNSDGFTFHTIGPWIMIFFVTLFIPIFINQISTHNWKKERGSTANFVYNDALYALWWFAISIVNNFRWWLIAEKKSDYLVSLALRLLHWRHYYYIQPLENSLDCFSPLRVFWWCFINFYTMKRYINSFFP